MRAILSEDEIYRYWLERRVAWRGLVFAFFGVNPSTADHRVDDRTSTKLRWFTRVHGGRKYILGNPFARRAKDVKDLKQYTVAEAEGPENLHYLKQIVDAADILVPCWGDSHKVPKEFRYKFERLEVMLWRSRKPMMHFGLTKGGSPAHPLFLKNDTKLIPVDPTIRFH